MRLPNFIIMGAMKSATSSLQEQLVRQPGIFMCSPKEPNFFSDDDQFIKGIDWYASLFNDAPEADLLGEASTHYTKLPNHPHTVERLCEHLPQCRFIYVMRHPIDRLISHYIHEWSTGVYQCGIETALKRYPEMIDYSKYSMQLELYFNAFGRDAVLPVFFDRLISEPQAELERVCEFIGYDEKPQWFYDLEPSNVSSKRIKRFPLYNILIETDIFTWLRRKIVPQHLRDLVKNKLTMNNRPELSESSRAELEAIFDHDLAILSKWLNQDINCNNFKTVTSQKNIDWIARDV